MEILKSPLALLGLLGQALFFSRWIIQWLASEKRGESHVPIAFWWVSLSGGMLLLVYAFLRHDPVFIIGQTVGVANYSRNIVLILRKKESSSDADQQIPVLN